MTVIINNSGALRLTQNFYWMQLYLALRTKSATIDSYYALAHTNTTSINENGYLLIQCQVYIQYVQSKLSKMVVNEIYERINDEICY